MAVPVCPVPAALEAVHDGGGTGDLVSAWRVIMALMDGSDSQRAIKPRCHHLRALL